MKFVRYSSENANQWNEFVKNSKNGLFMFDRKYMDYHSDRFHDHSLMVFDDKDKLAAVLPANEKDGVLYSHQGLTFGSFITDKNMKVSKMLEVFDGLKEYCRENGFEKMIYKAVPYIYHKQPSQEDMYALFRNGASLYRVDVSTTINLRDRIGFADLRKRGVNKARKNDVTVIESTDYQGFMDVLSSVLQDRHDTRPVHTAAEIELLAGRFPENIRLYTAVKDGEIMAGSLIFIYDTMVHSQYIASSEEGRNLGALDLVFSHLITEVYQDKQYFDFGISTEDGGNFLNEGLISQKEGFGGRAVTHNFYELDMR